MDAHELVSALKDLCLELGRVPTRREFESKVRGGGYQLGKFGGYEALKSAAGIENERPRKINNTIFERPIERQLEAHAPTPQVERPAYPKLAVISDIHWPFSRQRVIDAFLAFIEKEQPEYVVLNGDAWDMYSHAKFPRSHNIFTPREEMRLAREMNENFWKEVKKRCPNATCIQMLGNHDIRPLKRVLEIYPAAEDWIEEKLKELFTFDGVRTIYDHREEVLVGDVAIFHGYRSQLGAHRDYTLYNCINGHTHRGGTVFRQIRGQVLWELNSGYAGDPEAKGLSYTPQKIVEWTPGFAYLDSHGPRFIPA